MRLSSLITRSSLVRACCLFQSITALYASLFLPSFLSEVQTLNSFLSPLHDNCALTQASSAGTPTRLGLVVGACHAPSSLFDNIAGQGEGDVFIGREATKTCRSSLSRA